MDPKEAAFKVAGQSTAAARRYAAEFRDFLLKTNMFALAMAVVIGAAVTKVVAAIVEDLVMPIVGVVSPSGDWRHGLQLDVWRFHFKLGDLLGHIVDFSIIATVVFLITKMFVRQSPPPPTKTCPMCLEQIQVGAKRCKFCTSEVPNAPAPSDKPA
jgi:large conductance mechanosensitive channel